MCVPGTMRHVIVPRGNIHKVTGLLHRNGRDSNDVAVRANHNLICENLLQRRDLLLQTALVDHVACMRPNILIGVEDGESMHNKWYFEVGIDHIEQTTGVQPHIRIGWVTTHFQPLPDHGDGFSFNETGDAYSYGSDGRAYDVSNRVFINR